MKTPIVVTLLLLTAGISVANAQKQPWVADTVLAGKWYGQAFKLQQKGNYDSSNVLFEMASVLYQKHRQWAKQLDCDNKFSIGLISMGKYDEALQKARLTLKESLAKLGAGNTKAADADHNIGLVYFEKGDLDQAAEHIHQALDIRLKTFGEAHPDVAVSYSSIGDIYFDKSEYDQALEYYQKALQIKLKTLGETHPDVAASYSSIGVLYRNKGESDKALEYYQKALQLWIRTLGEANPHVAFCYNSIGIIYYFKGEYDQALGYNSKALQIRLEILGETHLDVAASYNNRGSIYKAKGDYEKAVEYYQKALQIRRKILGDNHRTVAGSYNNLGVAYYEQGDYEKAVEYYQKSLQIWREALGEDHPDLGLSYKNLGVVYKDKGEYDKALEYHQKSLQIDQKALGKVHPSIASSFNEIGDLYQVKGDYWKALQQYQQAILANTPSFHDTLLTHNPNLGNPASSCLERFSLLRSLQSKAIVFEKLAPPAQPIPDLLLAYQTYCSADTLAQQIQHTYTNESDQLAFTATAGQVYQKALPVCLKLHQLTRELVYLNQAFYFAERSKAGVLSATLAESKAKTFAGIADSLLTYDQQLRTDIAQYTRQLAEEITKGEATDSSQLNDFQSRLFVAHRQQERLTNQLEKDYPRYYALKYQLASLTPQQLQAALDDHTAVVEYSLSDSLLLVFTLTHRSFQVHSLPLDSSFHRQVAAFHEALLTQDQNLYQQVAYQLYQVLLPPTFPKSIQQLLIIPEGELTTLPFEALLTKSQGINAGKPKTYLLDKYAISYAYSARLLYERLTQPQETAVRQLLALAPVFADTLTNTLVASNRSVLMHHQPAQPSSLPLAGTSLNTTSRAGNAHAVNAKAGDERRLRGWLLDGQYVAPLPASEREVNAIAHLFRAHGAVAQVYLHGEAREEQLKTTDVSRYSYLHLATHGFVNERYPELSGLLLAQDPTSREDGILYTGELYNLRLKAELVTLSACETGLGKVAKGEGVIGLTRALLYAGARNVLVSFWKVPDDSTADLMEAFYAALLSGQDKAGALRAAKRKLVGQGKYAQPFYWAPFILVGK